MRGRLLNSLWTKDSEVGPQQAPLGLVRYQWGDGEGWSSDRFGRKVFKPCSGDKSMSRERDDARWIKRGKQRQAVALALRKPMTSKEICVTARTRSPRLQLRDVWHLLGEMQARGLVNCHNPRLVTGRLYELTVRGRAAVAVGFAVDVPLPKGNIDWRKYSWVVRAKVRRVTLVGLAGLEKRIRRSQTATAIRKHVRTEHPVGLNPVVRALKDLLHLGLIREAGLTTKRCRKLYLLTPAGRRVVEQLKC